MTADAQGDLAKQAVERFETLAAIGALSEIRAVLAGEAGTIIRQPRA